MSKVWATSGSPLENSVQLSEPTKRTRSSSGMTTVARDSANRRSRRFRRRRLSFTSVILDHWERRDVQLGPHPQVLLRLRNKDCKAVESLLSNDFVFTSPYDYGIDRETYFKRCWYSLRPQNQDWGPIPEHGIFHYRRRQDKRSGGLLRFCPKGTGVNKDYGFSFRNPPSHFRQMP